MTTAIGATPTIAPTSLASDPAATPAGPASPSFDLSAVFGGSAQAMGLSAPANVLDQDMIFAQVTADLDSTASQTGQMAVAAQLAQNATLLGQLGAELEGADGQIASLESNPEGLLGFLSFLANFVLSELFGLQSQMAAQSGQVQPLDTAQSEANSAAMQESAKVFERMDDRQLTQQIVTPTMDERTLPEVSQQAAAVAVALGIVADAVSQVVNTATPQNAGVSGPQSQVDGRVRLAV
jgi:hypothetical protein